MTFAIIPEAALSIDDAEEIYRKLMTAADDRDEDSVYLINNLHEKAVRYAHIRAEWNLKSREEKIKADEGRTMAHNSFIAAVNMLARFQKDTGEEWQVKLGKDDRKRIGEFACYISLFLAIDAR